MLQTRNNQEVYLQRHSISCSARHIFLWMYNKAWVSNLGDFLKTFFFKNKTGYERN